MPTTEKPTHISRRRFLITSGWLATGVTVLTSFNAVRSVLSALPTMSAPESEDGLAWIQALPDGRIRFFCPRMEMGQGASLGLSQVLAEELNVGQRHIECVFPETGQTPPFKMTVGSESIFSFFEPVSYGAARLREALRTLAAQKVGLTPDQIQDGRGGFILPDGTELSYGAVTPSAALVHPADGESEAGKTPSRYAIERRGKYQFIGYEWKHHDLESIVTGQPLYSSDVSVPNMLYGQVLRPPAFGAQLESVDNHVANSMAGVVAVVIDKKNNFVGVVTTSPFALPTAVEAINARWRVRGNVNQAQLESALDVGNARVNDDFEHELASQGDIDGGRRTAQNNIAARYDTSFAAHSPMEPRAAVAWVKEDKVEIWCASQDPFLVQRQVATIANRAVDEVIVHPLRIGGGFGGRVRCQASEEAARLSVAVARPVRVQWTRQAEQQNNHFQPAFSHFIDAGVTAEGTISHWEHDFVSSPIMTGNYTGNLGWVVDKVAADAGTARGAISPYKLPNQRIRYSDIRTEVITGPWRGLGAAPNAFAIESMIDELATAAKIDPLEFRLRNLPVSSNRLADVLQRVAEISDWGRATPPDVGRGLACAVYKNQTAVAIVVDVRVDHSAKELRVTRAWCSQDCGLVVNPCQVESLIMGNIVWGCSMALKERITVEAGAVAERNFDTYKILRHHECPEITVALVEPANTKPVGVGESALAPVAPAIANAVFAASGHRVRRLPISYGQISPNA